MNWACAIARISVFVNMFYAATREGLVPASSIHHTIPCAYAFARNCTSTFLSVYQRQMSVLVFLVCFTVVSIMLPTLLSSTSDLVSDAKAELALSRFESVLLLLCYGLFLVFQLYTHRYGLG